MGAALPCPGEAEWLEDPRFAKQAGREKHTDELEAALVEWFSARKTAEVVEHLSQYRVPAAPINTVEQAASDPHLHQRKILVEVSDPVAGRIHVPGKLVKFSSTEMVVGSTPTVGQYNHEV